MSKSFFESKKFKTTMNFVYGIGAAVVIVGALFKILHLKGADIIGRIYRDGERDGKSGG